MQRGDYVRLTAYRTPQDLVVINLSILVLLSDRVCVLEGWLMTHIKSGGRIRLMVRKMDEKLVLESFESGQIIAIRGQYVQTRKGIYDVQNVPPSRRGDSFATFA